VRCVYSPKHRLHDPRREVQLVVVSLGRRTVILQEGGYHVGQLGENVRQWLRGFEGRESDGTGDD
jgi:hypothetical protein